MQKQDLEPRAPLKQGQRGVPTAQQEADQAARRKHIDTADMNAQASAEAGKTTAPVPPSNAIPKQ